MRSGVVAEKKLEHGRPRELRRTAETAELTVEGSPEDEIAGVEDGVVHLGRTGAGGRDRHVLFELGDDIAGGIDDLVVPGLPGAGQLTKHRRETGMAVAALRREVSPAEEGLQRSEEHTSELQ